MLGSADRWHSSMGPIQLLEITSDLPNLMLHIIVGPSNVRNGNGIHLMRMDSSNVAIWISRNDPAAGFLRLVKRIHISIIQSLHKIFSLFTLQIKKLREKHTHTHTSHPFAPTWSN